MLGIQSKQLSIQLHNDPEILTRREVAVNPTGTGGVVTKRRTLTHANALPTGDGRDEPPLPVWNEASCLRIPSRARTGK